MLMQNFKSAADLRISDAEQSALIKVLGMLERGELVDVEQKDRCKNGFNIGTQGRGCDTPACIGGWVATLMKVNQIDYVDSYLSGKRKGHGLCELYWNFPNGVTTVEAATALRSYLTTGDARWDLAVA